MIPFRRQDVVSTGPCCTVWREPQLLGVRITGTITPVESNAWRTAVATECARRGHPRFLAFDMADCSPSSGVATRTGVAFFLGGLMKQVQWAALHTRMNASAMSVVGAVLRLVSIPNVTFTRDDAHFAAAVESFRRGEHPPPAQP